ncbi:MAG: hypothetical protein D6678_05485 [Zetaproteobacteria bacterium]|nr:MAG: hypothetical protein D6678_05485 [Zetaproteobacteria bacterium]
MNTTKHRTTRKRGLWLLPAIAMTILVPTAGTASECHGRCHMHAGHGFGTHHHAVPGGTSHLLHKLLHQANRLQLDKKQRDELASLLADTEAEVARQHARAEVLAAGFRESLHAGKVNEADILAYAKKMGEIRGNILATRLLASHRAMALLSKKQRAILWEPHHAGVHK